MTCPSCGQATRDEARFCPGCGAQLQAPCPNCGTPALASSRFCEACGETLRAPSGGSSPGVEPRDRPHNDQVLLPGSFAGGRYQVRGFLGEGGRKRVYAA
jgi:predicted amidophosphoribosyltransferase